MAAATLGDLTEFFPINVIKVNWFKISASAAGLSSVLTEF